MLVLLVLLMVSVLVLLMLFLVMALSVCVTAVGAFVGSADCFSGGVGPRVGCWFFAVDDRWPLCPTRSLTPALTLMRSRLR